MNIHEARNLFKLITNEFIIVARSKFAPVKIYWWLNGKRLNRLQEIFQGKKWNNGHYVYYADAWQIQGSDNDGRRKTSYLTTDRQIIYQERFLSEGGTIDDVQINTSMVDLACSDAETLMFVCKELLTYALDFGLDSEKIKIWNEQLS